ncbi:MAG: leucine-rich repeat domain-containing protein [Saprospiraceae bacterium]|nr:leucine-rich repeat domain-containing protein [Candidatus Vicinibacter affinis]
MDRIARALVGLSKPHWRLVLWIGSNGLESVPESVWELANLEELRLDGNKLKTLSPAIAKLTKLRRLWIGGIYLRAFRRLCASWSNWRS